MTFKLADAINRKSQIAIEYCYRWHNQYPQGHVFWIHASTPQKIYQAYHDIGRKLTIPGWNDPAVNTFKLVSEWLSNNEHRSWLLVLDNADDMETFFGAKSNPLSTGSEQIGPLVNYIPRSSNGSTIITTRDKRVGQRLANREKLIEVVPMERPEAESLLLSKVPLDYTLDKVNSSELLELLGYLPLAISQAAAYISENSISVEDYLKVFQAADSEMQDLLSVDLPDHRRDFEMRPDMQNSVIRTWKVSFDQIRTQKPRAAEILSLMAVLDRQGILKMLLRRRDEHGTELTTALGTLLAFSLITAEKGGDSFKMHRLVQVSTQRWLDLHGGTTRWRESALKRLAKLFPSSSYNHWTTCEALLPHVRVVTRYTFPPNLNLLYAQLLFRVSCYEEKQGWDNIAYEKCFEAFSIRKVELGPEHRDTLHSMFQLGMLLDRQGKYQLAEDMQRQVLDLSRRVLGPTHRRTLSSMSELAYVLQKQGKYEAAEKMQRQAAEQRAELLGLEHPKTISSMAKLAHVLQKQGRHEAAEEILRQAIELEQKPSGLHTPSTLSKMSKLASVLRSLGNYETAKDMENEVFEQRRKLLGPEHPDTITSITSLGGLAYRQRNYVEAEKLQRQALEVFERTHGPDHPETLATVSCLAATLREMNQYNEASVLFQRALLGSQDKLGLEHPRTLKCSMQYSKLLEKIKQS